MHHIYDDLTLLLRYKYIPPPVLSAIEATFVEMLTIAAF